MTKYLPEVVSKIIGLIEQEERVYVTGSTRRGPPSSAAQLLAQRDALLLGDCYADLVIVHRSSRGGDLTVLSVPERRVQLLADRLGSTPHVALFKPASFPREIETPDFISIVNRVINGIHSELDILHDRRSAQALLLGYHVGVAALYVQELSSEKLQSGVDRWKRISRDVELPEDVFGALADSVMARQDAVNATRSFAQTGSKYIEDQLLLETDFARYRASIWKMGCKASLAAAAHAQGANDDGIAGLMAIAQGYEKRLGMRIPPLPARTGDHISDSATILHYLLHALGGGFAVDTKTLYGRRASALLEAAIKSTILLMLYSDVDEEGGITSTVIDVVERSLSEAAIPSDLWLRLITAGREHKPFAYVKSLVSKVHDDVGDYLSSLIVASRVKASSE